jgi:hypothetical protein
MLAAQISRLHPSLVFLQNCVDLLSICLLRVIVWPFLKAKLQICPGSIQGSNVRETELPFLVALAALRAKLRYSLHGLRNGVRFIS